MSMTVKDKGWFIAALIYGDRIRPVIDFPNILKRRTEYVLCHRGPIYKTVAVIVIQFRTSYFYENQRSCTLL